MSQVRLIASHSGKDKEKNETQWWKRTKTITILKKTKILQQRKWWLARLMVNSEPKHSWKIPFSDVKDSRKPMK